MKCPMCKKNIKNDIEYIDHLEKNHKNSGNCGCGGSALLPRGRVPVEGSINEEKMAKKLKNTMETARKKIEQVEKNVNTNAIAFGLKMDKRDINKIPIGVREKVENLLLENQYLRGIVEANDKQIKIMKKQVDKCISNIGVHYVIKK